jgi:DNA repair protein RecN (Recombination protein N)
MLEEVRVRDLALLERVDVTLASGLNVLSGETGEGKSLLMLAITLLLGARSRRGLVRSGASEAVIEGRFLIRPGQLTAVTDLVEADAQQVCLRRTITPDGQSRAYLDGSLCSITQLVKLASHLVDVHGQQQSLADERAQQDVLDRYAGLGDKVTEYTQAFDQLRSFKKQIADSHESEANDLERAEFLKFQIQELTKFRPVLGEEASLLSELKLLASAHTVGSVLDQVCSKLLEEDGSLNEWSTEAVRKIRGVAQDHKELAALAERLQTLAIEAEDVARDAHELKQSLNLDPRRMTTLEDRLGQLDQLSRRFRVSSDGLVLKLKQLETEVKTLEFGSEHRAEWILAAQKLESQLWKLGLSLFERRKAASAKLEAEVVAGLKELRMPHARFHVQFAFERSDKEFDVLAAGRFGPGRAVFFVQSNPGEEAQPLAKVASGGEMARVLLAIKGALAGAHDIPLLIFDEIDAGVGGRVGLPCGRRIASIARYHQVLVVTHLAQVAAFANHHLRVRTEGVEGRTRTIVESLTACEREVELAEMLGGDTSDAAIAQARSMLEESAQ